jgi:hypothetical protein
MGKWIMFDVAPWENLLRIRPEEPSCKLAVMKPIPRLGARCFSRSRVREVPFCREMAQNWRKFIRPSTIHGRSVKVADVVVSLGVPTSQNPSHAQHPIERPRPAVHLEASRSIGISLSLL